MKECKKCHQKEPVVSFRKKRNICRKCASIESGENYRKRVKNDGTFLLKCAAYAKKKRHTPDGIRYYLYLGAKNRAKHKTIEFSISPDDIILPTHCPILGIPLQVGDGGASDNSPSLDRIDSSKGYVKGNIEVMSYRANTLKNNASSSEIKLVHDYLVKHNL